MAYGLNNAGAFIANDYTMGGAGMLFRPGNSDPLMLDGSRWSRDHQCDRSEQLRHRAGPQRGLRREQRRSFVLPFLYRDGNRTLLPIESGTVTSARDLNNRGDTLLARAPDANSLSNSGLIVHADGSQTELPRAPGVSLDPSTMNDAGQVAGRMSDGVRERTFLYSGGQMSVAPEGFNAWRLDEGGRVLGSFNSVTGGPSRAAAFYGGQLHVLPEQAGYSNTLFGVVDEGLYAVGSMGTDGRGRAFLLQDGAYTELTAELGPVTESMLLDMNERGQILYHATGLLTDGTGWFDRTYLWDNGTVTDLGALMGTLVQGNPDFTYGLSLNDNGQVLVQSRGDLFVITPLPEPTTLALMLAGLCAVVSLRRGNAARMTA